MIGEEGRAGKNQIYRFQCLSANDFFGIVEVEIALFDEQQLE